jgi:hypothetical protein
MVKKIRNTTSIIAFMYSLSQIEGLFKYFNNRNKIKVFNELSDLLTLCRKYLYYLWKKNDEKEEFLPMDFMKELNKQDKKRFGFEKEKEPKVFLEYIIQEFNKQLNDKDEELKKEIDNSKKILLETKIFQNFMRLILKNIIQLCLNYFMEYLVLKMNVIHVENMKNMKILIISI